MATPPLPEGVNAVRVSSGVAVVALEDGQPVGEVHLPPGWYFTEAGHARLWQAVDRWQTRLDEMQSRLDVVTAPAAAPPLPTPEHRGCGLLAGACLVLGFVAGRWHTRHPHPK